jgi:hypothetical protein
MRSISLRNKTNRLEKNLLISRQHCRALSDNCSMRMISRLNNWRIWRGRLLSWKRHRRSVRMSWMPNTRVCHRLLAQRKMLNTRRSSSSNQRTIRKKRRSWAYLTLRNSWAHLWRSDKQQLRTSRERPQISRHRSRRLVKIWKKNIRIYLTNTWRRRSVIRRPSLCPVKKASSMVKKWLICNQL